ncbi:MAG: coproporphyrinogen III oxidase [Chitinophagaceae bacterium]
MAGIYIHIPFCKQACLYCNFHFTTSLRRKNEFVDALLKEIDLISPGSPLPYLKKEERIETIYFGGGTPSLLNIEELEIILRKIKNEFDVEADGEITLETNPDDISEERLLGWKKIGINRLSIGVQSFFDNDLLWMNRAHNAEQAINNLLLATKHFFNITVDLIYGTPTLSNEKCRQNVERAIDLGIPHLSCYALTVEPKTPLKILIREGKFSDVDAERQSEQFLLLMDWLEKAGYEHYEISNFSKPGFRSKHNSSYWSGKHYLGLGPSAHSYNGHSRQWNVSNNNVYIESIKKGIRPFEKEKLSPTDKLNEYIMTSLRTIEGTDLNKLQEIIRHDLIHKSKKYIELQLMVDENNFLKLTKKGKLYADGIAADLFFTGAVSA